MGFQKLSQTLLSNSGQDKTSSDGTVSNRIVYPAKVVNSSDPSGQNRLQVRIVDVAIDGKQKGGRDAHATDSQLPWCMPLVPEFFHVRPQVDEMVWVILENPYDNSSTRYWSGPIISSQYKLKFQKWDEAIKIFEISNFPPNQPKSSNINASIIFPGQGDVALQGRDDADLILKPREIFLTCGKFQKGTNDPNIKSPSFIQLRQFDEKSNSALGVSLPQYSQMNAQSTNINLYSPNGKFRSKEDAALELSEELKNFGELAQKLHPTVFGDELIKLLDIIIKVLLNHIHTPQLPLVSTAESSTLQSYSISGKLQNLLSSHIRIN